MNMKPALFLETDLFYEDEICDTKSIIEKYFHVIPHEPFKYKEPSVYGREFRTSLNLAKRCGVDLNPYKCTSWVPYLRKYMIHPSELYFNDLSYIRNYISEFDYPVFIRPNDGCKTFSGQVFPSKDKFVEECNWMRQNLNIEDSLLCMFSKFPQILEKEFRCIFVNKEYCSGSQYMAYGEKYVYSDVDVGAIQLSKFIVNEFKDTLFLNTPNIVLDVALTQNGYKLIEMNCFETTSFYESNLEKIYSEWSAHSEFK